LVFFGAKQQQLSPSFFPVEHMAEQRQYPIIPEITAKKPRMTRIVPNVPVTTVVPKIIKTTPMKNLPHRHIDGSF
jgi:hypothetical protein